MERKYSPEVVKEASQEKVDSSVQDFADSVHSGDEDAVAEKLSNVVKSSKTVKKI